MPNFVYVGMTGEALSSKGIHAYRRQKQVVQRWGAITVKGARKKKFFWLGKYPKKKSKDFRTVDAAARHLAEYVKDKLAHGYKKIPSRHGIFEMPKR